MKTGDLIHSLANPIARSIDAVAGTNVSGCSGCKKMRENLNDGMSIGDAIYERWFKAKQQGEIMKYYQITVVVESDTFAQAVEKTASIGEVLNAQVKPAPPRPTVPANLPAGMQKI